MLRTIHRHRRAMGLSYRLLAVVGVLSVMTGLGQAAVLIVLVRTATALTADTTLISGSIGPISGTDLTTGQLIVIGFLLLLGLAVAEVATSWAQASLFTRALTSGQRRMLALYSGAQLDTQTHLPRGENAEILFVHTQQAATMANSIGAGVNSLVSFGTLVVSALVLSPVAGLVVMVGLAVLLGMLRPLLLLSRRLGRRRATAQRQMSAMSMERLELSREVKAFGVDAQVDRPLTLQIDLLASLMHRLRFVSRMTSATYRIGAFAMTLGMMAIIDASNSTNLTALTGSLLLLLRSLSYGQAAQATYQSLTETIPTLEQLGEEGRRLQAGAEPSGGMESSDRIGPIAVMNVGYTYPQGDPVLHDVSMDIDPGDFVALVGPSGAGKSTLMYLLLRLRSPTTGEILVNGVPASDLDLAWWRERVAYVPQEPKLQSGSVIETIRFNRPNVSDAAVLVAARRAHIADEIESWTDGYDTDVGQLGELVSGGQRQRLALARALAGEPDLLLLDEPTSAIDPTSEKLIGQTFDELRGEMTIIVIAHRFSTVERANRVILLENGRVVPHETNDLMTLRRFMGESV